jgi:hypothetical protein
MVTIVVSPTVSLRTSTATVLLAAGPLHFCLQQRSTRSCTSASRVSGKR